MKPASIFSKFFLAVFANILLFFNLPLQLQIATYVYLCLLFALAGKWKQTAIWSVICTIFVAGNAVFFLYPENFWGHYVLFLFSGLGKMLPVIMVAGLMFTSTRVSELVYGLRCLRFPQWVIVPMSVLFRFFPTIRHDYHQIRDAMKFRGLSVGGINLLLHPARSLEYIYVPLLNNTSTIASDLTAAALTRGLANPGRKSSLYKVAFSVTDVLVVLAGLGILGCLFYA